jgi:hypothetical protein
MAGTLKVSKITNDQGFTKGNLIPYAEAGDVGQGGRQFIYVVGGVEWVVHEFREDGMFWLPSNKVCDIFMIAGGGSGGPDYGNQDTGQGGGGAGGALWRQGYTVTSGAYDIHIGEGGRRSSVGNNSSGAGGIQKSISQNGADTWAFGVIARGGGCGGGSDNQRRAQEGGCGGGGGARNGNGGWNDGRASSQDSWSGWIKYGNSGGNSGAGNRSGGGGGGIGSAGSNDNGVTGGTSAQAGSGGAGLNFSGYFGTTVGHFGWFGGGGGGGTYRNSTNTMYNAPPNAGGYGGGGFGNSAREGSETSPNVFNMSKIDGMNGTGGGGGGAVEDHDEDRDNAGSAHGKGGSGAVVIRYQL